MRTSYKKVRGIYPNKLSVTGQINSVKNNESIEFESSLERDYIYLLEFDTEVKRYFEQPIKIFYIEDNIEKYYVPDFIVEYWNGSKEIIEIKYSQEIEEKRKILSTKFNAAKELCRNNGYTFKIINEHSIRTPLGWNAKFLHYYKYTNFNLNIEELTMLINRLLELKRSNPMNLIQDLAKDERKQAELLYLLWYGIATYSISFDYQQKLSMNTVIWVTDHE
ncbi:TnsA endonuclease N-terminal domain-containing protein [Myroides odoratimimus]|uniref:TnsA endonuclease N-terminal domain-containing protein n=1 Tax=Myroides odoratimimus TaxID=76832 RepID=UPI00257640F3|nr:TnsA endonuclease N-terminal domain-containing protein [Myroides odoratimimus]MDM1397763.1 TnsA endonuclease N-terminal domain-containing protein [Myroides odoratimimus]